MGIRAEAAIPAVRVLVKTALEFVSRNRNSHKAVSLTTLSTDHSSGDTVHSKLMMLLLTQGAKGRRGGSMSTGSMKSDSDCSKVSWASFPVGVSQSQASRISAVRAYARLLKNHAWQLMVEGRRGSSPKH